MPFIVINKDIDKLDVECTINLINQKGQTVAALGERDISLASEEFIHDYVLKGLLTSRRAFLTRGCDQFKYLLHVVEPSERVRPSNVEIELRSMYLNCLDLVT